MLLLHIDRSIFKKYNLESTPSILIYWKEYWDPQHPFFERITLQTLKEKLERQPTVAISQFFNTLVDAIHINGTQYTGPEILRSWRTAVLRVILESCIAHVKSMQDQDKEDTNQMTETHVKLDWENFDTNQWWTTINRRCIVVAYRTL